MKKKSIALIIGLMSIALLGVMGMQLYFLRQSYQMQSATFDRDVNEALSNVAAKISKHDADKFLTGKARVLILNHSTFSSAVKVAGDSTIVAKTTLNRLPNAREKKNALMRDSLMRMITHKRQDDEINQMME
jgi:two-component system phosphate regulon sensor histidine kinase PhoR